MTTDPDPRLPKVSVHTNLDPLSARHAADTARALQAAVNELGAGPTMLSESRAEALDEAAALRDEVATLLATVRADTLLIDHLYAIEKNQLDTIVSLRKQCESSASAISDYTAEHHRVLAECERLQAELTTAHRDAYDAGFEAGRGYPNAVVIPDA